jgi:type VI secretion system protein ImpI
LLSKRHFAVAFRGGAWQVADISTNGTYLNAEPDCIGRGATRSLRDGDRLRVGTYEIGLRLEDQPEQGGEQYVGGGFHGSVQSDHSSSMDDAMVPPPVTGHPAARSGGISPGDNLLPDADPFGEPDALLARHPANTSVSGPPPDAVNSAQTNAPFDESSDPIEVDPIPLPSLPAAVGARPAAAEPMQGDGAQLAAFFKGAQLDGATPSDPLAMMTELGTAFRAMVSGLREVLIARATIKSEFRIEQTMIRARGNNPLKFSANDDDALTALLGVGRRTDMAPATAIEDSLRDLRVHELAVMTAMQTAVRAMLEELSPEKIRGGTDPGGMTVLPAQRKARAWDAFETRHAAIVRALVNDFDSIFSKSFARAYERALDDILAKERQ